MSTIARIFCPRCNEDVHRAVPDGQPRRARDLVVCAVTGHGLEQPEAAARRAAPVTRIAPTLSAVERHLRRIL